MALAHRGPVTAIDIQEYSRVICSAILVTEKPSESSIRDFLALAEERYSVLGNAIAPLCSFENECLHEVGDTRANRLSNIVEQGSMIGRLLHPGLVTDPELARVMDESNQNLESAGLVNSPDSLVTRYYGGIYFSYEQALELDSLLSAAFASEKKNRDLFVAAVLSTASATVNTIGKQFAQPIRPRDSKGNLKTHLVSKIRKDRSANIGTEFQKWLDAYNNLELTEPGNVVVRGDFADALDRVSEPLGAVYADPPYTRDHYSRFYHVLETMSLRDNPEISTVKLQGKETLSRGLYRSERHQSPFCIRSQAPDALRKLFACVKSHNAPLVLSYSPDTNYEGARPRVLTIEKIRQTALDFFRKVEIQQLGSISHNKLNSSQRILGESVDAEVVFICTL